MRRFCRTTLHCCSELDLGEYFVIDHATESYRLFPVTVQGESLRIETDTTGNFVEAQAVPFDGQDRPVAAPTTIAKTESVGSDSSEGEPGGLMVPLEIKVTPTSEQADIHGWRSDKYLVDVRMSNEGRVFTEMWTSSDLEMDGRLYKLLNDAVTGSTPGYDKMHVIGRETSGVPVRVVNTFLVGSYTNKTTTEIVECSEQPAPVGVFDLPLDYRVMSKEEWLLR